MLMQARVEPPPSAPLPHQTMKDSDDDSQDDADDAVLQAFFQWWWLSLTALPLKD